MGGGERDRVGSARSSPSTWSPEPSTATLTGSRPARSATRRPRDCSGPPARCAGPARASARQTRPRLCVYPLVMTTWSGRRRLRGRGPGSRPERCGATSRRAGRRSRGRRRGRCQRSRTSAATPPGERRDVGNARAKIEPDARLRGNGRRVRSPSGCHRVSDSGAGALPQPQVALGGELGVCIHHDSTGDAELACQIARGRHLRTGPKRGAADRGPKVILNLRPERSGALPAHRQEQFYRLTGLVASHDCGSSICTSENLASARCMRFGHPPASGACSLPRSSLGCRSR